MGMPQLRLGTSVDMVDTVAMEDMAMVVMDMAVATMERGRLRQKLSLDTSEEYMVDMAMVDTAVATMARGRLKLSLDTSEEDMVDMDMVFMAVATMEREAEAE